MATATDLMSYDDVKDARIYGGIIIPFEFLDLSRIDRLDLFPGRAHYDPSLREPRPQDPFTAWVTMAHLGLIEKGIQHQEINPDLDWDRDRLLAEAGKRLTEEELFVVETIAVPRQYRELPAAELEAMVRTARDYLDRLSAACWLVLTGWTESPDCTFDVDDDYGLADTVIKAVRKRPATTTKVVDARLMICETHYSLNGPPPYELTARTVPADSPGWRWAGRLVPAER